MTRTTAPERGLYAPPPLSTAGALLLAVVLVISGLLATWNLDLPLGWHLDEPTKVGFVRSGTQNFLHPLLLIQLARAASFHLADPSDHAIAMVGRGVAVAGALVAVAATFLLSRRWLSDLLAAVVAAIVATTPLVAVHAHYFKEDTLLLAGVVITMLALAREAEGPSTGRAAVLGAAAGLACSAKYIGVVVVLVAVASVAIRRRHLYPAATTLAAAGGTFVLVNAPALLQPEVLLHGLGFELRHMTTGHGPLRLPAVDFLGTFHLRHSLAPGMGLPLLAAALLGTAWVALARRDVRPPDGAMACTAMLIYATAELSPTKPPPDFMRYMLPLVPMLVLWAVRGARLALLARPAGAGLAVLIAAGAVVSATTSVRLVEHLTPDTRAVVERWLATHRDQVVVEELGPLPADVISLAMVEPFPPRGELAIASSFVYDSVFFACATTDCAEPLRTYADRYRRLLALPHLTIEPAYRSFAYSNPQLTMIDLHPSSGPTITDVRRELNELGDLPR